MISDALVWTTGWLVRLNWIEIAKFSVSLLTLGIAVFALKTWQRQDKAKREAEFLDSLIEATHAYIVAMSRPVALVRTSRIGMLSHTSLFDERGESDKVAEGAIPYIRKDGERDAERLFAALNEARPPSIKLRSLSAKGQVFGFGKYARCHNAVVMLLWQFDRIEAFASIIGSPTMNWDNPHVQRTLQNVLTLTPDDIQAHLSENDVAVLEYAKEVYSRLYGSRHKHKRRTRKGNAESVRQP